MTLNIKDFIFYQFDGGNINDVLKFLHANHIDDRNVSVKNSLTGMEHVVVNQTEKSGLNRDLHFCPGQVIALSTGHRLRHIPKKYLSQINSLEMNINKLNDGRVVIRDSKDICGSIAFSNRNEFNSLIKCKLPIYNSFGYSDSDVYRAICSTLIDCALHDKLIPMLNK